MKEKLPATVARVRHIAAGERELLLHLSKLAFLRVGGPNQLRYVSKYKDTIMFTVTWEDGRRRNWIFGENKVIFTKSTTYQIEAQFNEI